MAYAPDGRSIAAAHGFEGQEQGSVLMLLDAESGKPIWQASERNIHVLGLAFAPDGLTIAAGCGHFNSYNSAGFARLRDARTGAIRGQPIPGAPGGVLSVSYAPDGRQIALASRDVVDLWDVAGAGASLIHQLRGHVNFVYAVAFSPDGRRLATGGWDKTIQIWDRATGERLDTLNGHRGFVRSLAFSSDGSQLVSGSEDKSVRRWDLAGNGGDAAFHGHDGFVHGVAFSPDGALAASGSQDGTVKLWPAAAPDSQVTFRNSAGWVGTLAFAPDGRRIASAHDGSVRIWDPRTGEELHRLIAPRGLLARIALAFAPDGASLVASGPGGSLNLWDTKSWERRPLEGHHTPANDAAFSRTGSTLATSHDDGTVQLWDVARRTIVRTLPGHAGGAKAVAFAFDGNRLASAGEDKTVRVWDVATGEPRAALTGHITGIQDIAFSPDGFHITSVGGEYHGATPAEVKVWNWPSGRQVGEFGGHTSLVTAVAYFPDGRRLATASDDRTIKIWDVATRDDVLTLRGHTSGVVSLAISGDGRQVASGSIDYTARIWTIDSPDGHTDFAPAIRRAAVERVQSLFAKHLLQDEVLKVLRADRTLSPQLRAAAIAIAEHRAENASRLYEVARLTIVRPSGRPEDYALALRQLEAACRVVRDDPARLSDYRHCAWPWRVSRRSAPGCGGDAQRPRNRRPRTEPRAAGSRRHRHGQPSPRDVAKEAHDALDQLRSLLKAGRWADDPEALGFLQEAERVVGAAPKP